MNIPNLTKIIALDNYHLELYYENGEHKLFDFTQYLSYNVYKILNDINNFKNVQISFNTATWFGNIDISPDRLYLEGENM